ncbi:hypothetical protein [Maribacter sp. Hel_I_7]|uniref:hypothetical protein n=1 Tax=Maribacter sp. Hel_I_7 TaxID=1249997 RepID=UPI00047A2CF4|nr:hypothetical protein [Maribacter sp. Hel_I_7]
MIAIGVLIAFMIVALIWLGNLILKLQKKYKAEIPVLADDEHVPVIKKGESNVTIINKENETVFSDEEGNLIPFKKTL